MTRTLAVELAHRNPKVRVNCIHPGPVMFPPDASDVAGRASAWVKAAQANQDLMVAAAPQRFFVPPFRDPLNPNLDPNIITGIDTLGSRALFDMTREGFSG